MGGSSGQAGGHGRVVILIRSCSSAQSSAPSLTVSLRVCSAGGDDLVNQCNSSPCMACVAFACCAIVNSPDCCFDSQNGGTCVDYFDQYKCICAAGFSL